MTLVQLEYIIALDNYRHFAVAAEKCFVTQPTLSMQIQKLEDTLDVKIFDRSKHPIEPTKMGVKILEQARIVIAESKKVQELIDQEKNEIKGDVRIAIIPTLAPYLVPLFVSPLTSKYEEVSLQITESLTDSILDQIKKDQVDIGILVTPIDDADIREIPILYEEFFVYASHQHPLFQSKKIETENINTSGLWLLNEGHCFRNQTLNICGKASNHEKRFTYESGSLEALKRLVDKNGGYTLLPELYAMELERNDQSKLRHFLDPVPTREVSLVVKKSFAKHQLVEAIRSVILENLPPLMKSRKNSNVVKF